MQYGFEPDKVVVPNKEALNKTITDEQIYFHYYGEFKLDEWMFSPRGENNPSFKIDYYDGELVWRDFGYDCRPANAVNFVQYLEDLQGRKLDYLDAIQKIAHEVSKDIPYKIDVKNIKKQKGELRVRFRHKYQDHEKAFWRGEKIKRSTLLHFDVFPCEIWYGDKCWHYSRPNDPLYCYLFNKEEAIWKGYRPLAHNQPRFIESNCNSVIQGWNKRILSSQVVVTKSYKDVMSYFQLGYAAVAPQSENSFLTEYQLGVLKEEYDQIFINYDPDDAGLRNMARFSEEHSLPYFHFGDEGVKDLTELRKSKNEEYVRACLRSMMTI